MNVKNDNYVDKIEVRDYNDNYVYIKEEMSWQIKSHKKQQLVN